MRLFCDCKTDEEKSNFFLSGKAVETGVIAPAISNEVAMAYHRCAQFKKENEELRASLEVAEKNLSCCQAEREEAASLFLSVKTKLLAERDALRARIELMEQQEPSHWGCTVLQSDGRWKEEVSREVPPEGCFSVRDIFPLYLAPGAKGE